MLIALTNCENIATQTNAADIFFTHSLIGSLNETIWILTNQLVVLMGFNWYDFHKCTLWTSFCWKTCPNWILVPWYGKRWWTWKCMKYNLRLETILDFILESIFPSNDIILHHMVRFYQTYCIPTVSPYNLFDWFLKFMW